MKGRKIKYFLFWIGISLITIIVLKLIIDGINFEIGAIVFLVFLLPLFVKFTSIAIVDNRKLEYAILTNFFRKKEYRYKGY